MSRSPPRRASPTGGPSFATPAGRRRQHPPIGGRRRAWRGARSLDSWGRRVLGERTVNPIALAVLLVVVGSGLAGLVWLYRLQLTRQADALRAEVALAEQGRGGKKLEKALEQLLQVSPHDADALDKYGRYLARRAT